ncbi:hypothetical protein BDF20DRAFT_911172 [Mycotypha africana]|uniref:uncharacterized protein n=1 Tax=Mycotypha africana TaxID=64632 RepID=UPI0022FFF282|nr:uncharacterized protein BDF20DRAFT_911172 [Mycotypha africana]KAI8983997.1 hypothetical protein BDF20DRAFT_911172 [Mycotypha africana]
MSSDLSEQAELCSDRGNEYPFCLPTSSDVWQDGSTQSFVWNKKYPFYVDYERLDLYLYHYIKFEYINVKNFTNLERRSGGIEVTVDDSWFLSPLQNGESSKNWTMMGFYLPSKANPAVELASPTSMYPRPFNFTVTQLSNSSKDNTNPLSTNSNSNNDGSRSQNGPSSTPSTSLPAWAIAAIVIGIIGLLCAAAALIWLQIDNNDNASMTSKTYITGGLGGTGNAIMTSMENISSVGSLASSRPFSPPNTPFVPNTPPLRPPPIPLSPSSSTNDWHSYQYQPQSVAIGSNSGSNSFIIPSTEEDEELRRRRLGEALLQRQLAEDGTSVKHAGRLTRVRSLADIKKKATIVESGISQRQHSMLSSSSSVSSCTPTTGTMSSSHPLPQSQ